MIGRMVNDTITELPPEYIWGDLLPILRSTDLNLINLEAALTTSQKAVPKVFNFKADPERVACLKAANVTVANLANNHVLDYSEAGLLETLNVLKSAGIQVVGAGRNLEEANQAVIIVKKGIKIAILGCTDNEPDWKASSTKPGTHYLPIKGIEPIQTDLERLKKEADIVVLTFHWGPNMKERPSAQFVRFAHAAIECGVDLFHGHSAHIFQGVEVFHRCPILYDTGDFVDDYYVDPQLRNDRSFLFLAEISQRGVVGFHMIPVLISNCQVNLAQEDDFEWSLERMVALSKEFGTDVHVKNDPIPHLYVDLIHI